MDRNALVFSRDTRELENIMWYRNCKVTASLICLLAFTFLLIIWYFCGFGFQQCWKNSDSDYDSESPLFDNDESEYGNLDLLENFQRMMESKSYDPGPRFLKFFE